MNSLEEMKAHLLARSFDVELYPSVVVDFNSATFPLWNLSGQMVGYQLYQPDQPKNHKLEPRLQRYFTYVSRPGDTTPSLAAWGLESLRGRGTLMLCEGVIRCV